MSYQVNEAAQGVLHIRDEMGVCMTLLIGEKAAMLVDTGYGTENVAEFAAGLTDLPLTVLLTHHHHDHALGAKWFDKTVMFQADMPSWRVYTGMEKRHAVYGQAKSKGIAVNEDEFMSGECKQPYELQEGAHDLGGMTAVVTHCPGHTPGSACILIPERKLLLTGDNWNPCTWLFFSEALGVREYRSNVRELQGLDFTHVLCSHQLDLYPRHKFDDFMNNLTDDVLRRAKPVVIGGWEHLDLRQADVTDGQILVFDWAKAGLDDE